MSLNMDLEKYQNSISHLNFHWRKNISYIILLPHNEEQGENKIWDTRRGKLHVWVCTSSKHRIPLSILCPIYVADEPSVWLPVQQDNWDCRWKRCDYPDWDRRRRQVTWLRRQQHRLQEAQGTHDLAERTFDSDKRTLWKYFSLRNTVQASYGFKGPNSLSGLYPQLNRPKVTVLGVARLLNLFHFGMVLPCCHTLHILWNWSPTTQGQSMQTARYSVPAQHSIELRLYCSTAIIVKVTALTIISECFQLGAYQTWKNTNVGKYIHAIGITAISCDLHYLDHFAYCFSVWDLFSYTCLLVIVIFIVCFLLFLLWPKFANYCEIVNNPYMWSSSALCMPQRPRDRM